MIDQHEYHKKNNLDAGALEEQAVPAFTSGTCRVTVKRHAHHVMCKSCWIHKEYGYEIYICSSYLHSN
jgi:hypothetical protein